jgi:hypothetical protein
VRDQRAAASAECSAFGTDFVTPPGGNKVCGDRLAWCCSRRASRRLNTERSRARPTGWPPACAGRCSGVSPRPRGRAAGVLVAHRVPIIVSSVLEDHRSRQNPAYMACYGERPGNRAFSIRLFAGVLVLPAVTACRRQFHRNCSARAPDHRPKAVPASSRPAPATIDAREGARIAAGDAM